MAGEEVNDFVGSRSNLLDETSNKSRFTFSILFTLFIGPIFSLQVWKEKRDSGCTCVSDL